MLGIGRRAAAGRAHARGSHDAAFATGVRRPARLQRLPRLHSAAGDGPQLSLSSADLATNKLSTLKQASQDYFDRVLQHLREQAAASSSGSAGSYGGNGGGGSASQRQLRDKIAASIQAMQEGLVERDTEVRLLLLAALSREHVLYIGPPGTAKSEIGRRLSQLLEGSFFERLLTRFSVPEELFGPLSMRALEEDRYVRQTNGYLPEAQVAFIDEIFKANSAILNTLLTILNERLFDNGSVRVKVPLISMVGASNELPESEELDALYDRFLIRRQVQQVTASGLAQMLEYYSGAGTYDEEDAAAVAAAARVGDDAGGAVRARIPPELRLVEDDFATTRATAIRRVRVPSNVVQLLADLRAYLQERIEPPVYVSDRRLVKAVAMLQVAAYCDGRDSVSEYDCLLLEHVLWQRPEQAPKIADWLLAQLASNDGISQVKYLLSGIFARACKALGDPQGGGKDRVADISAEVAQLRQLMADKLVQVGTNIEGGFPIVLENLWLGEDEGRSIATALVPKLQKTKLEVEELLYEVATLEVALQAGTDAVTLANLMPKHWANFIRNSPMEEVKPIGTTQLRL